jgi:hypothetical protein
MKTSDLNPTYLVASDFDQTLSFNDSGLVLSELLGMKDFAQKVAGLSCTHLVQQGAELTYLLRHDPQFREVRHEHLIEAGKRVRLKQNVDLFTQTLAAGLPGAQLSFSSSPPRLPMWCAPHWKDWSHPTAFTVRSSNTTRTPAKSPP